MSMKTTNFYFDNAPCLAGTFREKHILMLLDMIGILKSKLSVEALYILGVRHNYYGSDSFLFPELNLCCKQYHIDLLVICKKVPPNAVADLSSHIQHVTKGMFNVILLLHKLSEIKGSQSKHHIFFDQVRQKAWWLGGPINLESIMPKDVPVQDAIQVQQFCTERCRAAKYFLHMEYHLDIDTVSLLKVHMLQQSVVQLSLGLIYKYMNYHPNQFHLRYLLNLCNGFTTLGEDIFPVHSTQDKELMQVLTTSVHDTRHKKLDLYKLYHVQLLEARCRDFYERTLVLLGA